MIGEIILLVVNVPAATGNVYTKTGFGAIG